MSIFSRKVNFSSLNITKDYHSHLLPGVDDGFKNFDDSLKTILKMSEMGYKDIILTPHVNPDVYPNNTETFLKQKFNEFTNKLPSDLSVNLSLGAEYMLTEGFENRNPSELLRLDNDKILIEMSYYFPSQNIDNSIFNIFLSGFTPVLAHPERYLYLANNLSAFDRWYDMGCRFQLNLYSLSGVYGSASLKIINHILSRVKYDLCGSDIHTFEHFMRISSMNVPKRYIEIFKK